MTRTSPTFRRLRTALGAAAAAALIAGAPGAFAQDDSPAFPQDPFTTMFGADGGRSSGGAPESPAASGADGGGPSTGVPYPPPPPPAPYTTQSESGGGSSSSQRSPPTPYTARPGSGPGGLSTGGTYRQPSAPDPTNPFGPP